MLIWKVQLIYILIRDILACFKVFLTFRAAQLYKRQTYECVYGDFGSFFQKWVCEVSVRSLGLVVDRRTALV